MTLVFANWKMVLCHHDIQQFIDDVLQECQKDPALNTRLTQQVSAVILPPFPYLSMVQQAFDRTPLRWGAQDCAHMPHGAYTGDVSAKMITDFKGRYVLIGHSERRHHHGEDVQCLGQKVRCALDAGLIPIYCIGENQASRLAGQTLDVLKTQIQDLQEELGTVPAALVIAYEPLWAIGTGAAAGLQDIGEVHGFLNHLLPSNPLVYGGSVTEQNAAEIAAIPHVDGLLVGGASTDGQRFLNIIRSLKP